MLERIFFGTMFSIWFASIGLLCVYEPQKVELFLLCMKYTFLGLLRMVGLY